MFTELAPYPDLSWSTKIVGMSEWLQPLETFTTHRDTPAASDVRVSFPTDEDQVYNVYRSVDSKDWTVLRHRVEGTGGAVMIDDRGVMVHGTMH